jgi:PKD repeat protein
MLRIKLLFCLVLLFNTRNFAQNLVPNPSFEIHSTCPTNYNQVTLATGWQKSLNNNAPQYHTEYLNACSSNSLFQVPNNTWGIQAAFNGQAYMALNTMAPSVFVNYRENIYIQLIAPLVIGQQYKIKLHVSHTDNSKFVTNNLGVKFSTTSNFPINNSAHIFSSTIITTNTSWDTIQGFFIADSAYQYMAIGNFFTDANTTRVLNYPSAAYSLDAYYIDDVSVTLNCIPPIATITGNVNSICPGDSITLTVSGGSTYLWNTGAIDSIITVKPVLTTLYTVVAGNGTCNSNPDSAIVTILPIPVLTLLGDTVSCNNSPVQLIALSPTAQSIHWSNNILTLNDTVSVAANFPAYISAYAFDGQCNSQLDSIWVDTLSSPTLSVNFLPSSCINDTVHFSANTNASNFTWNFGHSASGASNTSNLANPIHVYNSAGNFSINLVAQNYCGSTSFTSPITIQSGPTVSLTNDTTICKGNSISLNAGGGTNYQWSGAINATASSVLVSPLVNSTYLVKASNGSCFGPIDSVTVSVAVQPLISLAGDSVSCNSGPVQLIANCPSGQTFHWSSGISSTNDTILISTGFPAYISAYAFDGICNSMLDSIWVDTLSSPTLSVNFLPSSCINDTVHFSASTNASNFTWNFGHSASGASNTSNLANPIHVYNSAGNYSINLVAQNYCGSMSYTSPITVQVGPQVQVPNDTTICKGQSVNLIASGGTNYVWTGAISSNVSSVLVTPLVPSTYIVKASNGTCFGIPDTIVVNPIDKPIVLVSGIDTVCNSELITLTATGASTYFWNGASGTSIDTIQVAPNVNSTYSVVGAIGACLSDTSFF